MLVPSFLLWDNTLFNNWHLFTTKALMGVPIIVYWYATWRLGRVSLWGCCSRWLIRTCPFLMQQLTHYISSMICYSVITGKHLWSKTTNVKTVLAEVLLPNKYLYYLVMNEAPFRSIKRFNMTPPYTEPLALNRTSSICKYLLGSGVVRNTTALCPEVTAEWNKHHTSLPRRAQSAAPDGTCRRAHCAAALVCWVLETKHYTSFVFSPPPPLSPCVCTCVHISGVRASLQVGEVSPEGEVGAQKGQRRWGI